jgi:hypothetical protein
VYESVLSMAGHRQDLSVQECTDILFNEFRPFLTNMQATVDIYGSQGE